MSVYLSNGPWQNEQFNWRYNTRVYRGNNLETNPFLWYNRNAHQVFMQPTIYYTVIIIIVFLLCAPKEYLGILIGWKGYLLYFSAKALIMKTVLAFWAVNNVSFRPN